MPLNVPDEAVFWKLDAAGKQQWFKENVLQRQPSFESDLGMAREMDGRKPTDTKNQIDREYGEALLILDRNARLIPPAGLLHADWTWEDVDWAWEFGRLSSEGQLKFFRGWQRTYAVKIADEPADPKFASPSRVYVTLPNGSQHADDLDRDDDVPSDYQLPENRVAKPNFGPSKTVLLLSAGGLFGLVMAGGLYVTLTGDGVIEPEPVASVGEQTEEPDGTDSAQVTVTVTAQEDPEPTVTVTVTAQEDPEPTVTVLEEVVIGPGAPQTLDYQFASHHYTVTVDGDGEALAALESTSWYSLSFITTTADGTFDANCTWAQGRDVRCRTFSGPASTLVLDAVMTAEWTSPDTVVVSVDNVGNDSPAELVVLELAVRASSSDAGPGDSFGTLTWEP